MREGLARVATVSSRASCSGYALTRPWIFDAAARASEIGCGDLLGLMFSRE
jgi:hypothetical protein